MNIIKVKTPAKINLTLEIIRKREDGFHELKSVMQAVSLFDYLTIEVKNATNVKNKIVLTGNNQYIPYDETNLAHIAAKKFLNKANITNKQVSIHIEKNIPVAAGLAGGSSNAAGTLYGLNKLFNLPLKKKEIDTIASSIGSDVNFCLYGGTQLTTGRGEQLEKIKTQELDLVICKPKNLGISAKEAYTKFANLNNKPNTSYTEQMISSLENNEDVSNLLTNHLENAIIPDYKEIKFLKEELLKQGCINSLMSGSGPSVFGIYKNSSISFNLPEKIELFKVKTISVGIEVV